MFEFCSSSNAPCAAVRSCAVSPPESAASPAAAREREREHAQRDDDQESCRSPGEEPLMRCSSCVPRVRRACGGRRPSPYRTLTSTSPALSSLSVTNEIDTAPPSPRQVQLGGLRSSLLAEHVRMQHEPREQVAAETRQAPEGARAHIAPEHLDDVHLGRRIPLERVDGAKGRGVRDREPVPMRAGQERQRRVEVLRLDQGLEVDGDPAADDRDTRSRDGERRERTGGRRTRRRLVAPPCDDDRGDRAADHHCANHQDTRVPAPSPHEQPMLARPPEPRTPGRTSSPPFGLGLVMVVRVRRDA